MITFSLVIMLGKFKSSCWENYSVDFLVNRYYLWVPQLIYIY